MTFEICEKILLVGNSFPHMDYASPLFSPSLIVEIFTITYSFICLHLLISLLIRMDGPALCLEVTYRVSRACVP
jgi:hypothetical protein